TWGRYSWTWTQTTHWLLPGSCSAKRRRRSSGESTLESRFWAGVLKKRSSGPYPDLAFARLTETPTKGTHDFGWPESRAPGSQPAGPLSPQRNGATHVR